MALTSEPSVAKESQLQNCWKCFHDIIILVMMLFGLLHDIFEDMFDRLTSEMQLLGQRKGYIGKLCSKNTQL